MNLPPALVNIFGSGLHTGCNLLRFLAILVIEELLEVRSQKLHLDVSSSFSYNYSYLVDFRTL